MLCKMTEGADVSDIANISVTVVRACNAGKNIKTCFLCYSLVIVNHI